MEIAPVTYFPMRLAFHLVLIEPNHASIITLLPVISALVGYETIDQALVDYE